MSGARPYGGVRLPEGSWWDWEVIGWDAGQFRLASGHDLAYHHGLELVFDQPAFVSCPAEFQDPVFRAPTREEWTGLTRRLGGVPPVLVAFEADAGGREPVSCLVAAEGVRGRARDGAEVLAGGSRPRSALRPVGTAAGVAAGPPELAAALRRAAAALHRASSSSRRAAAASSGGPPRRAASRSRRPRSS
ncbi:hypothetical protein GCM10010495_45550 [Kitasatospora herbaricolor]|nr:hypothetical protein GCM10010495_45550 [Kitasatospora herbaricolor]